MDFFLLILLLNGCQMVLSFHRVIYEYHAIHLKKTWWEARKYCRQHYTDLATFRDMDDINSFERPSSFTEVAWIGLFDDPSSWKQVMGNDSNSWKWSVTGATSPGGYQNWVSTEPDHYKAGQAYGLIRNGLWGDAHSASLLPFVCFSGSVGGPKQYTYISTSKSWGGARSHCRQHYTDLAMIENESENSAVASLLVQDQWAWFGLYRLPWRWADGSNSRFTNWLPGHEPNNLGGNQHCVWEDNDHEWNDRMCSELVNFVCQKALRNKKHQFTVKLQSDLDLSDPTYSTQMTKKLIEMLQDKGLTDLNVKWKAPPQKLKKKKTSLDFKC